MDYLKQLFDLNAKYRTVLYSFWCLVMFGIFCIEKNERFASVSVNTPRPFFPE